MFEAEGLLFETEEEAALARKEAEGIRYIKEKMQMDNPDVILKLYHDLLEKRLFETEVGLRFLFELQDYLRSIPYIKSEDIKSIPANKQPSKLAQKSADRKKSGREKKEKRTPNSKEAHNAKPVGKSYRVAFVTTLIVAIALAVIVVGMFVITYMTGNNTNIVNYENEIINRYEGWEQELNEREQQLNECEAALEEKGVED